MHLTSTLAKAIVAAASLVSVGGPARAQEAQSSASLSDVGVVSHLHLLSDKSEDISTLEAWKKTYIKEGMSEQEKTIAIFNTVVKYRHQANPPAEFLSSAEAGGHVHDPLKTFHVYGYNQCCCASADVIGLAQYLGLKARGRDISRHSVPEVFYNNGWHLVDGSVMNYQLKDNGEIASVDEINQAVTTWLKDHPELVNDDKKLRAFARNRGWKNGPALLSKSDKFYGEHGANTALWHGWSSTMQEYYEVRPTPHDFTTTMGYQLNVQLRPGEKITRNFFSRGIDFTNKTTPTYYPELLRKQHFGIQVEMGDRAPGRLGDGTIEWDVPINMQQLPQVALTAENLAPVGIGIGAADPSKPGVIVLRFPSSYVYVKGMAFLQMTRGQGNVTISFSDNNGLDYRPLYKQERGGDHALDLTQHIFRRYDYRIKIEINGAGVSFNGFRTINEFQCSQAALPTLTAGENKITFRAGPSEGTIITEGSTETAKAKENKQLVVADFHPIISGGMSDSLQMTGDSGSVTFPIVTPGDLARLRISAVYRARNPMDGFEIQASYDGGKSFKTVKNGNLDGGTTGSSRYIIVDDVPPGVREAQIRISGKMGASSANPQQGLSEHSPRSAGAFIFDWRIDADYKEPSGGFKPVRIVYEWKEGHETKSHVHTVTKPEETYSIICGPETTVRSFSMELAD